ncbi:SDR family NAD(P)-dependent oxidoreductase [Microvirga antarctica]|uniref:SDR family NAD(P)-dependent oxidoreductase n=1 Tax=Microvirga antarctica TaxID=2819233 RepID=UPI001B301270|nr:SDR family oxidoreductase [Microvirga antarctica]
MGLLKNRVALVTGAGGGLGRAIAHRLQSEGATGIALDLDEDAVAQAAPSGWISAKVDVRSAAELQAAVAKVREQFGRLDIVVANAGLVPPWRETETIDFDEWDRVFAVNVRGVAATIKAVVPAMKKDGGSIIALGSLNSWKAHGRQCLYSATKHAVLGIVRATALDLGRYGIRVNAVGPGAIATEALITRMTTRAAEGGLSVEDALRQNAEQSALQRMATDEDVANSVLFLASDLSAAQTGLLLPVDAGIA